MQSIGNKILSAAKARNPKGHHPRIIMTESDFARLRENREAGAYKPLLDKIIENSDCRTERKCIGQAVSYVSRPRL